MSNARRNGDQSRRRNPKHRHDAVLALEVLQTFSAEASGDISPEGWGAACLSFNERIFGADNILSAVLHLDEKTPHVHTLIVPFHAGKLSAAHWIDGPQKCRALQNSFFTEVAAGFGLERGQIGSNRKHIPQKLLYRTSNELHALAEKSIKQLGTAAVEPLQIEMPDLSVGLLTQNGRVEFQKTILTQVHRHWNALIKREREQMHTLLPDCVKCPAQGGRRMMRMPGAGLSAVDSLHSTQALRNRRLRRRRSIP